MIHDTPPSELVQELRRLTASELSFPARLRYVGLLLAAVTMTVIVTALLVTEPSLPRRTSIALALLALMGASWIAFAAWVLTHKRVLLGRQRVIAGHLAVGFSAVFSVGALVIGYVTSNPAAVAAAAMGLPMFLIAATLLSRAKRQVQRLSKRRDDLVRQLEGRQL